ncbi:MAG: hypothetical protein Q7T20_17245 [Saprospiraceae bacterium]|nr:hypothetical protein [Saprospiraceae bacterium]
MMKGVDQIEHAFHNLASPKRGHTFWGLLIVLAVAALLIWAKHNDWLSAPNEVMFANNADGFKNYMTSAWHVQHDSSYVHYGGMNYPFGEHVLFSDNQPVLSAAMQWWSRHVFDIGDKTIGIIHLSLVVSIIFGAGVIYLLLRKLHLPVWYAGLAAIGIAFLSPQHNRFDGQFGLSHIWVLPMLLLFLCRYEERHSRRYQSLLIGILIWFSAQLHFYNLGVSAIFLSFYTLFQILLNFSWRNIWTRLSHLTVMVLLPFAVLNVWLHWSDYCPDRPAAPYGFTEYIGHWEGVFLPYEYFPMHQWINQYITKIRGLDFEAQSYAGLVAFVFTLWLLFKRRLRLFEPEWEAAAYHRVHKNYLRGICFAAFATLFFSLGFPFSIKGLEWMVDYFGPIRQFRGLGRFTWAFYYAINVLIFYILWNKSQRIQIDEEWMAFVKTRSAWMAQYLPNAAKWSLALIPMAVLCWEAYYFQKHKSLNLMPNLAQRSVVADSPNHWLNKVDFTRFQSLMPLPYYHIGSENIWLEVIYPLYQKVQYTALQTGVPDMGVNMSRSAVSRMVKSFQFSLNACEPPALLSEMSDNRPIALMIDPVQWDDIQENYQHLISKATRVYESPELKIMALVPDSIRAWSQQQAERISDDMDRFGTVEVRGGWRSESATAVFTHLSFDSLTTSEHIFQGKGAGEGNLGDTSWIWNKPMPKGAYVFSIWIKADEDLGLTQEILLVENSKIEGREYYFRKGKIRAEIKTIVKGWALLEGPFEVEKDHSNFGIFLHKKNANAPFWYDEVMIKASNFNLYRREPGWVVRNNYWYKLPKNWPNH